MNIILKIIGSAEEIEIIRKKMIDDNGMPFKCRIDPEKDKGYIEKVIV